MENQTWLVHLTRTYILVKAKFEFHREIICGM